MIEEVAIEVKTTMESPTLSDVFTATAEPTPAELADTEAQAVIQAVEPILKKCKEKRGQT